LGEEQKSGSGRKIGLLGCLVFWGLAVWVYFWIRRTPWASGAFETVRGWVDSLRAESPWWLAAILGFAVVSPAGLIWLVWRRLKRRGGD
jgi:hypothetical protein